MWKKIFGILGLISVDEDTATLDFSEKVVWMKWRIILRGYFIGFILYPWVWVWGLFIMLIGTITYLSRLSSTYFVNYIYSLPDRIPGYSKTQGYAYYYLVFIGFILLINYTISYFTYRKNNALGILVWILSLWLLVASFLMVYITWQFNIRYY
ncbi:MAG: hypothetical protein OHK0017_02580 [Patescibacteria group bacterium]